MGTPLLPSESELCPDTCYVWFCIQI
jgi:hypothetical protein